MPYPKSRSGESMSKSLEAADILRTMAVPEAAPLHRRHQQLQRTIPC